MRTKYERDIYLFLSLYRFFAYGLAVVLIQALPDNSDEVGLRTYTLLATVGAYTLLKVLGPLRWQERGLMTYVVLGGDLLVCQLALLLTGGLTSGFLLYSFLPVISAALLFQERLSLLIGVASAVTVAFAHLVLSHWMDRFTWVMDGNILPWLIFYAMAIFLFTTAVFRTNQNIRQRIQQGAIVEERGRMRREIHDGVAQAPSYLSMKTDTVSRLVADGKTEQALTGMQGMREAVGESYKAIRESLDQLSVEVGAVPLTTALQEHLKQFEERNGIQARLEVPEPVAGLSSLAEFQVLRITQEALVNVRKHSKASNVCVALAAARGGVEVSIKDNGRGFDPSSLPDNGAGHHGLLVMGERAEGLGGAVSIKAAPGEGTEVRLFMPAEVGRVT